MLCKKGQNLQAIEMLYSPNIESVEAMSMPNMPAQMNGVQDIIRKNKWWVDNHTIHSSSVEGPYPNGDRFIVHFSYDITNKESQQRMKMDEVGLYTTKDGKVVREEFFYVT